MPPNGADDLQLAIIAAFEKVAAMSSRQATAMRSMSETILQQGERRERESEKIREEIRDLCERVIILTEHVSEARGDIEKVREDTDPRIRLYDPAEDERHRENDGALVALARIAEKVPTPWVVWLLKLSLPAGVGAAIMRGLQWLATGH